MPTDHRPRQPRHDAAAHTTQVAVVWFDGQRSEGVAATLALDANHYLTLRDENGQLLDPEAVCPARLHIAPPLGDTARTFHFGGSGRGESRDLQALAALEHALGRGWKGRALARLESAWPIALTLGALVMLGGLAGLRWGVPWAAEQVAIAMPDDLAHKVGAGTLRVLDTTVLKPSRLQTARKDELRAGFLTLAAPYDALPLTLHFRRGVGPNAFALPDGTVLLTDELVALATDDRQLFAVLAHEIGHVHHRHGVRMALEGAALSVLVAVVLGDATELGNVAAGMPAALAQAQFSQAHEIQADDFALETLVHAGISPRHFAVIMRRLQASAGGPDRSPVTTGTDPEKTSADGALRYLASHPPTEARVARFATWPEPQ